MDKVNQKIHVAPSVPGVYLFMDRLRNVIYIGKAADLKKRLTSYLNKEDKRYHTILSHAADIDIIITSSDVEALTLEESLIKLNKPRYNVRLKDDKKFPYLKLTVQDEYPRILFTRDIRPDNSLLFGPYTNARALRNTRNALCRIFKLVSCTKDLSRKYTRPCLEYNLGRCSAPCTRQIEKTAYSQLVKKAIRFLQGNSTELEKEIEKQMWLNAERENFEAAAQLRNQLLAIRSVLQRQHIIAGIKHDIDIIGISRNRTNCVACQFRVRNKRLTAKEIFPLKISAHVSNAEISSAFIRLMYTHISFFPPEIVIATAPHEWGIQARWFKAKGFNVKISHGRTGIRRRLLTWAQKNADNELTRSIVKARIPNALLDLQNCLQLKAPPRWIEAFDISNLKDKFAVGASVAFYDGRPSKQRYRKYKIKRVTGQNDFAMIHEIVSRRIRDLKRGKSLPDILIIDGGIGQLHAALQALKMETIAIPVFAIAKRYNELYDPVGNIIMLPPSSGSMLLLKRLRDEAHRFAIGYHRTIRGKTITTSILDTIPSIGTARKRALIKYFGTVDAIKKASQDNLAKTPGIGKKTATIIYHTLHL